MRKLFYLMLITVVFSGLAVFGEVALAQAKLTVTSSQQIIDYGKRIITYKGNVQATHSAKLVSLGEEENGSTNGESQ